MEVEVDPFIEEENEVANAEEYDEPSSKKEINETSDKEDNEGTESGKSKDVDIAGEKITADCDVNLSLAASSMEVEVDPFIEEENEVANAEEYDEPSSKKEINETSDKEDNERTESGKSKDVDIAGHKITADCDVNLSLAASSMEVEVDPFIEEENEVANAEEYDEPSSKKEINETSDKEDNERTESGKSKDVDIAGQNITADCDVNLSLAASSMEVEVDPFIEEENEVANAEEYDEPSSKKEINETSDKEDNERTESGKSKDVDIAGEKITADCDVNLSLAASSMEVEVDPFIEEENEVANAEEYDEPSSKKEINETSDKEDNERTESGKSKDVDIAGEKITADCDVNLSLAASSMEVEVDPFIEEENEVANAEEYDEPSSKKEINETSDKEDNERTESGKSKDVDIAGQKITADCDVNLSLAASSIEVEVDPFIEEENEVANAEEYGEPSSKKEINETSDKEDNEGTESGKSKHVDIAGEKITADCDVNLSLAASSIEVEVDPFIEEENEVANAEEYGEPSSKKGINETSDKEDNERTESGKSKDVDIAGEKITADCDVNLSLAASSMEVEVDPFIEEENEVANAEEYDEPSSKKEINETSDKEDNERTESGKSKDVDIAGEKITAACDVNLSLAASSMEVEVDPFIEEENEVANAEEYDEPSSKKEIKRR